MKKKMYQDEELLRDKMLQHQFEPDESAWEGMEALLNGMPGPALPPPLPAASASSLGLLAGAGSWIIWIGGLALMGLLVVLAIRQAMPVSAADVATPSTPPPAISWRANRPRAAAPHTTTATSATAAVEEKSPEYQAFRTHSPAIAHATAAPGQQREETPSGGHQAASLPPASSIPNELEKVASTPTIPAATPATNTTENMETSSPSTSVVLVTTALLPPLPTPTRALPGTALRLPDMAHVQPSPPFITRKHVPRHDQRGRFQVGAALGGQWTIVNRAINKIALLPSYGLSLQARLTPRWWAETGLMYRQVKGYDLAADWRGAGISLDGTYGQWATGVSTQQLNYLEMPLLIKYAMPNGDQRLMLGLRAARVYPKAGSGFSSSANNYSIPQNFEPDIRQGFRRYDLALSVGVEARVRPNMWLDIRHNEGLYDLTYDNFFNNTQVDRATETQVTLRYYFGSFW